MKRRLIQWYCTWLLLKIFCFVDNNAQSNSSSKSSSKGTRGRIFLKSFLHFFFLKMIVCVFSPQTSAEDAAEYQCFSASHCAGGYGLPQTI